MILSWFTGSLPVLYGFPLWLSIACSTANHIFSEEEQDGYARLSCENSLIYSLQKWPATNIKESVRTWHAFRGASPEYLVVPELKSVRCYLSWSWCYLVFHVPQRNFSYTELLNYFLNICKLLSSKVSYGKEHGNLIRCYEENCFLLFLTLPPANLIWCLLVLVLEEWVVVSPFMFAGPS